jgi:hypothetical protein
MDNVFVAVVIAIIVYIASLLIFYLIIRKAVREGVYTAFERLITGTTERTSIRELLKQGVAEGMGRAIDAAQSPLVDKKKK